MTTLRERWAALPAADRLLALRTFRLRGLRTALGWRDYARRVRLAERRGLSDAGQRLLFARYLAQSGRIGEDDGAASSD